MECPICLGQFEDPRILACLHTLCRKCLEGHVAASATGGHFNCPSCRHQCQVPTGGIAAVPKNFLLNALGEVAEQQSNQPGASSLPAPVESGRRECHNSRRSKAPHRAATVCCVDCVKFYCETCESSHVAFDDFRDHRFIPATSVPQLSLFGAN